MDLKTRKGRAKAGKKFIDSSARCITCNKTCSMSGLCMKQWPEFTAMEKKGVNNDNTDNEKNS